MDTQVAVKSHQQFDNDQLTLIRTTVARGTTPEQFRLFMEVCQYHRLNPFARQIYAVVRGNQMTVQTSIDGFRLLAERTGKYAGQLGPFWCGEDGEWVDVWLKKEPPAAARIGVLRKDFANPVWGVARYSSYAQTSPLWTKMPDTMLSKCAESLALRKAFPAEMSGIYTHEEMQQADSAPMPTVSIREEEPVVVESTPVPTAPTLKEIFARGKEKKLWKDSTGLREFASAQFGYLVKADATFTPQQRIELAAVIDNAEQGEEVPVPAEVASSPA